MVNLRACDSTRQLVGGPSVPFSIHTILVSASLTVSRLWSGIDFFGVVEATSSDSLESNPSRCTDTGTAMSERRSRRQCQDQRSAGK